LSVISRTRTLPRYLFRIPHQGPASTWLEHKMLMMSLCH
jgi:hypothetical protein